MEKANYEKVIDDIMSKYNEKPVKEAFTLLNKLFSNIVNNPSDPKYKNFKKSNQTLKTKVLIIGETLSLLKSLGYEDSSSDILTFKGDIAQLRSAIIYLTQKISSIDYHIQEEEFKKREEEERIKRINFENSTQKFKQMEIEKERIRQQMENDKKERAQREKAHDSKGRDLQYGCHEYIVKPSCGGGLGGRG